MIGIGIPTVGLKKYLSQTIESIITRYSVKLLVVDNNSQDGTAEWLKQCGFECILNPENYGVARSWNQILYWGLSHDNLELCFIMNNDIILHPDALDNMIESVLLKGKEGISGVNIGTHSSMLAATTKPIPRYSPAMNFSCFGLTKSTITRIGFFDENFKRGYFEDNDYHTRMMTENIDCSCDLWAPFSHYGSRTIHEGGVVIGSAFEENKKYFINKWGCLPQDWRKKESKDNGKN